MPGALATRGEFAPVIEAICAHDGARAAILTVGADGAVATSVTYAELRERIVACAGAIARVIGEDEVLLLVEPSPVEFAPWFLGALSAGRWVLPAPPESAPREIDRLIAESGAVASAGAGGAEIAGRHGLRRVGPGGAGDAPAQRSSSSPTTGGIILRTSGTTGIPKLVQRTNRSLDAVAANVRESAGLTPDDTILAAIPAWHSYGVENVVLGPLAAGATVTFCNFDASRCERLLAESATVFPGVPMMFEALSRGSALRKTSLRLAYSAGSSLPDETASAFESRWGRAVGQLYGATDVGSVTFNDPGSTGFLRGSVGLPMSGVSVRILRDDGTEAGSIAGPDEEGQVAIKAPSMLSRYLGGPGGQARGLIDGHLPMGDLGRVDGEGRLTITGMLKFLIDVGGMKVNPLEVEAVLREHPDVADCAVVPLRVSRAVSRVRAIVTGRGRAPDPEALRAWSRERLAKHKVPRVIEVREALPRSATGKLLRRALEEDS